MVRHLLAPVVPDAARALRIARTVKPTGRDGVALTFDDGPHPEGTPAVLELLRREGYKAMFFMVGEQVERRPELAMEIAREGHGVALHGYRHRLQLRMSGRELETDMLRGVDAIRQATGITPEYHRPAYGIYSAPGLAVARKAGLRPLLWSRWGKDWRRLTTPSRIATRATRNLASGDVILLHDADYYSSKNSHRRTAQALKLIVAELERRGIGTVLPV